MLEYWRPFHPAIFITVLIVVWFALNIWRSVRSLTTSSARRQDTNSSLQRRYLRRGRVLDGYWKGTSGYHALGVCTHTETSATPCAHSQRAGIPSLCKLSNHRQALFLLKRFCSVVWWEPTLSVTLSASATGITLAFGVGTHREPSYWPSLTA